MTVKEMDALSLPVSQSQGRRPNQLTRRLTTLQTSCQGLTQNISQNSDLTQHCKPLSARATLDIDFPRGNRERVRADKKQEKTHDINYKIYT